MFSMSGFKIRPLRAYGIATLAVGVTLMLRFLLVRWGLVSQDVPYLLFFIPATLAAWIGGLGPGLFATFLSALLNQYFFLRPFHSLSFGAPDQPFRQALFLMEGTTISLICTRMHRAGRRAERNAREARQLERRILEISDAEQRRIGHDLHDGLGQHLTGIGLMTQQLEQRLVAESSPLAPRAAKISELAEKAVQWTHDLSRSLSPPVLESHGLAQALEELASYAENIFGIQCHFVQIGQNCGTDLATGGHLYRIAQEAISNAVKHGRARHVDLTLRCGADELCMQIVDDGRGILPGAQSQDGMGLRIMNYRAQMIGAELEVQRAEESVSEPGTRIVCRYRPSKTEWNEPQ